MPKPIAMMIEVEEIAFGKVWRTLDTMNGVIAIQLKGSGPKKQGLKNGNSSITISGLILGALQSGPLNRDQLTDILETNNKKQSSLQSTLDRLKKLKHIRKDASGLFKITAAGRKAIPAAQQE